MMICGFSAYIWQNNVQFYETSEEIVEIWKAIR